MSGDHDDAFERLMGDDATVRFAEDMSRVDATRDTLERAARAQVALERAATALEIAGQFRAEGVDAIAVDRISRGWRDALRGLLGLPGVTITPPETLAERADRVREVIALEEAQYDTARAAADDQADDATSREALDQAADAALAVLELAGELRAHGQHDDAARVSRTWRALAARAIAAQHAHPEHGEQAETSDSIREDGSGR